MTFQHTVPVRRARHRSRIALVCAVLLAACSGGDGATGTPGTVTDNTVASVQITNAPTGVLLVGDSIRLIPVAVNGAGVAVTNEPIAWASSAPAVATVSAAGVLVAIDAGTTVISVTIRGKTAEATVTVAYGANLGAAGGVLSAAGGRLRLTLPALSQPTLLIARPATNLPTDARALTSTAFDITPAGITFPALSPLTLQYDAASLPTGLAKESLQLYVLDGQTWNIVYPSTVDVATHTVTGRIQRTGTYIVRSTPVVSITLSGVVVGGSMYAGDTASIKATLVGPIALDPLPSRPLTWSSSASDILAVDSTGKLTAKVPGTATITVATDGKVATATVVVTNRLPAEWARAAEWAMWGANAQHTAYIDATVDVSAFRLRWSRVPIPGASLYQVTAGGGAVYAHSFLRIPAQALVALDASSGAVRWSKPFDSTSTRVSQPLWDNGSLFLQTSTGAVGLLFNLNPADGSTVYSTQFASTTLPWYDGPIAVGSSLVLGGARTAFGFAKANGVQQFSRAITNTTYSAPAAENGTAYILDGGVIGLTPTTGAVTMQLADTRMLDASTPVIAAAGLLVVPSPTALIGVNTATQSVAWSVDGAFGDAVAVANGKLYAIQGGSLTVRSPADGSVLWTWAPNVACGGLVVTNNVAFVSCDSVTYAVDLVSHLPVWSYPSGGYLSLSGPQGVLYIASGSTLTAISVR